MMTPSLSQNPDRDRAYEKHRGRLRFDAWREEYRTVKEKAGLFKLPSWAILRLTGADRKTFLHGMLTNDVQGLKDGEGNYQLFLNAKGKIQADLRLYDRGGDLLAVARPCLRKTLIDGLNQYIFSEDVEIHDLTDRYTLFSLQGPDSLALAAAIAGHENIPRQEYGIASSQTPNGSIAIMRTTPTGEAGFDFVAPKEESDSFRDRILAAGAAHAGPEVFNMLRLENGAPVCGADLDDHVIPQEAGLHHALNFNKGCYLGQEVVARLHFRGHVNREWTGFVLEADSPKNQSYQLSHENKIVGKITSAGYSFMLEKWIALGFLRSELREEGAVVTATAQDEQLEAGVRPLPFSRS